MRGRRADSSRRHQSRLPAIAPRQTAEDLGPESHPPSPVERSPSGSGRNKLPPRSRSGCWICRNRKVKCDEQRPACGQCVRLEYTCDYNPRVLFKDDTSRVVERMQEVSDTLGNSVWDPSVAQREPSQDRSVEDLLPPFAALTTDEERERKAELQNPGTYHVVANIGSFVALPEYREENASVPGSGEVGRFPSPALAVDDDASSSLSVDPVGGRDDPNVVILRVFEEPGRKGSLQPSNRSTTNPVSPASSSASIPTISQLAAQRNAHRTEAQAVSMLDIARNGGRDAQLLHHYRTAISPYILRTRRPDGDEDLFEIQARGYPPLFHAMMALAALSMALQNGVQNADALEHYQQVIPALKITVQSSQDSYSDGALFTHFILLLYEIAAAGHREHNMRQHHTDQLLKIVILRRQAHQMETYDFLVWQVCSIDIHALLSGSGTGNFVEVLLKENLIPEPERILPPLTQGQESVIYAEEEPFFSTLHKLNQEIFLLALRVGQLARDLRDEAKSREYENQNLLTPESIYFTNRRSRIQNLYRTLEHSQASWRIRFPEYWTWLGNLESLPPRPFSWVQHSYILLRACVVYAHTSMFTGHLSDPAPDSSVQIQTCVTEIIQAAHSIVSQEQIDPRFVVFSLFLAGFATGDLAEKSLAVDMMRAVERHSYGGCTKSVRMLLETICEKQRVAILRTGDSTSVGWVEEMELRGQPPIIYGI